MYRIIDIDEGRFGKKVCATVPLVRNTIILRFSGRIIDFDEALRLGDRESYALQVGYNSYVYLDAPACYFNHSCEPNCGIRPDLYLVSLRDIKEGEELTYDYSTTMLERKWTMPCRCGKPACRSVVTDFDLLPENRKRYYLSENVVQEFIREAVTDKR
jgi:uncharacterized protein